MLTILISILTLFHNWTPTMCETGEWCHVELNALSGRKTRKDRNKYGSISHFSTDWCFINRKVNNESSSAATHDATLGRESSHRGGLMWFCIHKWSFLPFFGRGGLLIWYDIPLFVPQWGNFKNHSSGFSPPDATAELELYVLTLKNRHWPLSKGKVRILNALFPEGGCQLPSAAVLNRCRNPTSNIQHLNEVSFSCRR